jgi:hypothetical protein
LPTRSRFQQDFANQVLWKFEKILVDREGEVVARFAPDIDLDDPRLLQAIDEQLARQQSKKLADLAASAEHHKRACKGRLPERLRRHLPFPGWIYTPDGAW